MPNFFFSVLQADLHNFILLWLVTHSEIPLSICSGIRSQWEPDYHGKFWPLPPYLLCLEVEAEGGGQGPGHLCGGHPAGLSPVPPVEGAPWEAGATGPGTSGPESLPPSCPLGA